MASRRKLKINNYEKCNKVGIPISKWKRSNMQSIRIMSKIFLIVLVLGFYNCTKNQDQIFLSNVNSDIITPTEFSFDIFNSDEMLLKAQSV